eukprot:4624410-Pyramimonas_sp.AAC.1
MVDQSPPGDGPVTRENFNRRVDGIVHVAHAFTVALTNMAINFHGAHDKHVDEVQRAADDTAQRIEDLTRQNDALIHASDD